MRLRKQFDVVIAGGGAAGCVVAARLSEHSSRSVLLIEAGPDFREASARPHVLEAPRSVTDPRFHWVYEGVATAEQSTPLFVIRGRVMGGSGAINGTCLVRGLPNDYDSWGSDLWSWPRILETFRRIETDHDFTGGYHGDKGPIPLRRYPPASWSPLDRAFYEATLKSGLPETPDVNLPERNGIGPLPKNIDAQGRRIDTAVAYLNPIRSRTNLTVLGETLVRRIVWDGTRAVGVEVEHDGVIDTIEAGEVILSAGGIGSPHLLFLSGVGAADELRALQVPVVADVPGVGKGLQDHPILKYTVHPIGSASPRPDAVYGPFILNYTADGSPIEGDLQLMLLTIPPSALADASVSLVVFLNKELSVGELRFASNDPSDRPRIEYRYYQHGFDRARAREGLRKAKQLIQTAPFRELIAGIEGPTDEELASDTALDSWILHNVSTAYHGSGTCRLGPAPDSTAVVDEYCRVRGVEGVRVVDLSIAPTVVRTHTFGTAVMIGERAAALIAEQL